MWGKGLVTGLKVTWGHFFGKKETVYYPEEKLPMTERFRGGHLMLDVEKCIGCKVCAMNCPNAALKLTVEMDENKKRHMTSYVHDIGRCMYCDCWEDTTFKEHSLLPYFKDLFDKKLLKNSNYGYIMFAGGEPALMRDFEEIIELCIENGMQRYIVNSNGIKFSKGIERLLKETEANVFVSLDSGCEATFNKVKNVPCFDKVVENLKRYANAQQEGKSCLWSKFIIIPDYNDSEEEILKWYDLSLSLGIKAVVLDVERE